MKKLFVMLLIVLMMVLVILPAATVFAWLPEGDGQGPVGFEPPGWSQRENPKQGGSNG